MITGALGHIGSYLIRDLPKILGPCRIKMIDNFLTQRYSSLFDLPDNCVYEFQEADITNVDCRKIFEGADVVIHLAAITDAAASFEKAELVETVNFSATQAVAKACLQVGVPLVHASSTSVYGSQNTVVTEQCPVEELNPQSPYAETKLKEENYINELVSESGLEGVTLRFGTIFGKSNGMRFHTAVNKFCYQAVMGLPLSVWRTAYKQKRPYLDLSDCSNAIAHVINNRLFNGSIYNVVTLNATVEEVIGVIKKYKEGVNVGFVDHKIMNQLSYDVSNTYFKSTGFSFTGDLDSRIKETIQLISQANK